MKVKVGDTVYDSAVQPVMVILSDADKANIKHMPADATKYAAFPDQLDPERVRQWMNETGGAAPAAL